jgi:hypothetical protein
MAIRLAINRGIPISELQKGAALLQGIYNYA